MRAVDCDVVKCFAIVAVFFLSVCIPDETINWDELDDIAFSTSAIPEPGTLSLIVMRGLALAARRWRAWSSRR
jgi:hypothetical protein